MTESKPGNLLRVPHVLKRLGFGKSTLWAWVASGRFPPPIKLGSRMSVWREEEVDDFIAKTCQRVACGDSNDH